MFSQVGEGQRSVRGRAIRENIVHGSSMEKKVSSVQRLLHLMARVVVVVLIFT